MMLQKWNVVAIFRQNVYKVQSPKFKVHNECESEISTSQWEGCVPSPRPLSCPLFIRCLVSQGRRAFEKYHFSFETRKIIHYNPWDIPIMPSSSVKIRRSFYTLHVSKRHQHLKRRKLSVVFNVNRPTKTD